MDVTSVVEQIDPAYLELHLVKGLLTNPPGHLFCRRIIEARAKTFHNSSSMSGGAREPEDVGRLISDVLKESHS
jgi:hypothetical protein